MGPSLKKVPQKNTFKNCFDKLKLLHKESSLLKSKFNENTEIGKACLTIYQLTPFMPAFVKEGGSELDIIWTIKNEMFDRFRLTEATMTSVR